MGIIGTSDNSTSINASPWLQVIIQRFSGSLYPSRRKIWKKLIVKYQIQKKTQNSYLFLCAKVQRPKAMVQSQGTCSTTLDINLYWIKSNLMPQKDGTCRGSPGHHGPPNVFFIRPPKIREEQPSNFGNEYDSTNHQFSRDICRICYCSFCWGGLSSMTQLQGTFDFSNQLSYIISWIYSRQTRVANIGWFI